VRLGLRRLALIRGCRRAGLVFRPNLFKKFAKHRVVMDLVVADACEKRPDLGVVDLRDLPAVRGGDLAFHGNVRLQHLGMVAGERQIPVGHIGRAARFRSVLGEPAHVLHLVDGDVLHLLHDLLVRRDKGVEQVLQDDAVLVPHALVQDVEQSL